MRRGQVVEDVHHVLAHEGSHVAGALGHARAQQLLRDHPRSPEITRDHPRAPEITQDHPRSPEITRDHPRSPEITRETTHAQRRLVLRLPACAHRQKL